MILLGWWRKWALRRELLKVERHLSRNLLEELEQMFRPEDPPATRSNVRSQIRDWLRLREAAVDLTLGGWAAAAPEKGWPWSLRADLYDRLREKVIEKFRDSALESLKADRWKMREKLAELRGL